MDDFPALNEDDFNFERIANFNDMLEHMEEIARASGIYHRKLQEEGFNPDQALMLVLDWHRTYWTGQHTPPLTIVNETEEADEDEDNED